MLNIQTVMLYYKYNKSTCKINKLNKLMCFVNLEWRVCIDCIHWRPNLYFMLIIKTSPDCLSFTTFYLFHYPDLHVALRDNLCLYFESFVSANYMIYHMTTDNFWKTPSLFLTTFFARTSWLSCNIHHLRNDPTRGQWTYVHTCTGRNAEGSYCLDTSLIVMDMCRDAEGSHCLITSLILMDRSRDAEGSKFSNCLTPPSL